MKRFIFFLSFLALLIAFFLVPASKVEAACGSGEINTALGCISVTTPTRFTRAFMDIAIGISGGIAILLIIYGAFLVLTSAGSPEKVQAGKELITGAITGLLLIVFAVFIMEMIGKKILGIFP